MAEELVLDTQEQREGAAKRAASGKKVRAELVGILSGSSRSARQHAAATVALVAASKPKVLMELVDDIADALNRPEAQTRWEILNALNDMGKAGQRYGEDVIAAAEDALYDEDSGIVREAAFRFFCGYGGASASNSKEVWPLIDEAVQCYHGNPEFSDMLTALADFAESKLDPEVSKALAERMAFDAENASGTLRMRAEQIVAACKD